MAPGRIGLPGRRRGWRGRPVALGAVALLHISRRLHRCVLSTQGGPRENTAVTACVHCAGFRTHLVFVASLKEGLEPRNPLLRDMVLLSAAVFLQVWLIRTASRLAVAAAGPHGHDAPRRRRSTEPRRAASTRSSRLSSY